MLVEGDGQPRAVVVSAGVRRAGCVHQESLLTVYYSTSYKLIILHCVELFCDDRKRGRTRGFL